MTTPQSPPVGDELDKALKRSYLTVTTIAKNDPLQDAFDTWLDVNGQRFGISFDRTALNAYILAEVLKLIDECFEDNTGYIDDKLRKAVTARFGGKSELPEEVHVHDNFCLNYGKCSE